jgi:hypothetical protein
MKARLLYSASLLLVGLLLGEVFRPFQALQTYAQSCRTFSETGKQVCGRFLEYWTQNGGLAQQGLPLSNEFNEVSELNGLTYTVQYFERAVFEKHPENARPHDVLLSQLGTFQLKRKYPTGAPTSQPQQQPTQQPTSPPSTGAPRDTKAFAEYIVAKYNKIRGQTITFEDIYTDESPTLGHYITLDLEINSISIFRDSGRTEVERYSNEILREARAVWPSEAFHIEIGWSTYSKNICTSGCSTDCYYQSERYTSGRGWFTTYTYVLIRHDKPLLICHYIK